MLNFGSLFGGDYAITGGFFICSQLPALTWFYQDMATAEVAATINSILPQFNSLPSAIQPAFTSLLVALTLLSVFFFGLLLDLIGSLYVIWELRLFRAHLERNRTWLTEVVDLKFHEYVRDDFINILSGVPADSTVSALFTGMLFGRKVRGKDHLNP